MDLITLSDLLVDMFPAEIGRRLADVSAFYPKPGGASANVAVAAQRLGVETAFIGKVGDDAFGHHLIDVMRGEGVETRGIRLDGEARTTMAVIALPTDHDAEFVFGFALAGTCTLAVEGRAAETMEEGDTFVVPRGVAHALTGCSADFELLDVTLPEVVVPA